MEDGPAGHRLRPQPETIDDKKNKRCAFIDKKKGPKPQNQKMALVRVDGTWKRVIVPRPGGYLQVEIPIIEYFKRLGYPLQIWTLCTSRSASLYSVTGMEVPHFGSDWESKVISIIESDADFTTNTIECVAVAWVLVHAVRAIAQAHRQEKLERFTSIRLSIMSSPFVLEIRNANKTGAAHHILSIDLNVPHRSQHPPRWARLGLVVVGATCAIPLCALWKKW